MLSNLATLGLKACLAKYGRVEVQVLTKNIWDLVTGTIAQVEVVGQGWQSPGGVTCRAIFVRTDGIQVDLAAAWRGQICLCAPTHAKVQLQLNQADFNHFLASRLLTHTLEKLVIAGDPVTKLRVTDLTGQEMALTAEWQGIQHSFILQPNAQGKAQILGEPQVLVQEIEHFFNHLVVDLQGLELRLDSFAIQTGLLTLHAQAKLWRFPEQTLSF